MFLGFSFALIWGIVIWKVYSEFSSSSEIEVPASWFGILNSFFIITMAPMFSKLWETKYNPSGPAKFALGLMLAGVGFAFLALGAQGIETGASTASVSMFWLIAAYFFHTVGEICLSPVGLSYVSKLTPKRLLGMMFGVWFLANFFANLFGGWTASYIDSINEAIGLSGFFLVFTAIPIGAGLIMLLISPFLKKRMHGIH
jgi:POT family proton-dependent oligopeptide transporter